MKAIRAGTMDTPPPTTLVRVVLPHHLRALARLEGEVRLPLPGAATITGVLEALETRHPVLRGTVRDPHTGGRRALVRFFAGGRDWSHEPADAPLPAAVVSGAEPLLIVGAMAGG